MCSFKVAMINQKFKFSVMGWRSDFYLSSADKPSVWLHRDCRWVHWCCVTWGWPAAHAPVYLRCTESALLPGPCYVHPPLPHPLEAGVKWWYTDWSHGHDLDQRFCKQSNSFRREKRNSEKKKAQTETSHYLQYSRIMSGVILEFFTMSGIRLLFSSGCWRKTGWMDICGKIGSFLICSYTGAVRGVI